MFPYRLTIRSVLLRVGRYVVSGEEAVRSDFDQLGDGGVACRCVAPVADDTEPTCGDTGDLSELIV